MRSRKNNEKQSDFLKKDHIFNIVVDNLADISKLLQTISNLDTSAINYYSNTDVPFVAEGKAINFTLTSEKVYPVLRNRVYSVRKAIVHSKEGEKLRYEPFIHDKTLAKEIPLIRAIAEEIIINSAKPLKFDN